MKLYINWIFCAHLGYIIVRTARLFEDNDCEGHCDWKQAEFLSSKGSWAFQQVRWWFREGAAWSIPKSKALCTFGNLLRWDWCDCNSEIREVRLTTLPTFGNLRIIDDLARIYVQYGRLGEGSLLDAKRDGRYWGIKERCYHCCNE